MSKMIEFFTLRGLFESKAIYLKVWRFLIKVEYQPEMYYCARNFNVYFEADLYGW